MSLTFDSQRVAEYVAKFAGKPFDDPFVAFGVERNGAVVGGFVFNNFTGLSIELSLAGPAIVSRAAWRACLNYVFEQSRCERMGITISKKNKHARRLAPKAGFVFEGVDRGCNLYRFSLIRADLPAFRKRWGL